MNIEIARSPDQSGLRDAEREQYAARWREQSAMVASRMRYGFRHRDLGQVILGRRRADHHETGLRSNHFGKAGKLFVAGCRKAPNLRGGRYKGAIGDLGPNKVLGLDEVYIEGNRQMVSLIRIDLDFVFFTPEHAISAIQSVVDDHRLPCMPHLICGDVAPAWIETDGVKSHYPTALIRPHIWIELEAAVNCKDSGRAGPKNLLGAVSRGLCKAFIEWGADPNAATLLVRGKNPLCPMLWATVLNNAVWPSLSEWAEWVDTRIGREELSRMAAEVQSAGGKGPSNEAFTAWQKQAYAILRACHLAGDERYKEAVATDRGALADLLLERMPIETLPCDAAWDDWQKERILGSVVAYAATSWDATKAVPTAKPRGAMRHLTEGLSTRAAQSASGQRSAGMKAQRALQSLIKAYRAVEAMDIRPTQGAVAKAAGVSRETASRRWAAVLQGVTIGV